MAAVRAAMRPELVNRLDDVVVFHPLDEDAIREIANREIEMAIERLEQRGYRLTISPEVVDLVAQSGYDPAYGARHLQRNVEQLLLMPLAEGEALHRHAVVSDDGLTWEVSA